MWQISGGEDKPGWFEYQALKNGLSTVLWGTLLIMIFIILLLNLCTLQTCN